MTAPWWWRYALPNAVTCISLSAGLLSISFSLAGDHRQAAWFILLSVVLDKLDGTVARLVRGTSSFGVQMDSLTDLICFGVAPAILTLSALVGVKPVVAGLWWDGLPIATYVASFAYVIAAALRLAKFNVVTETYGNEYFFGATTTISGAIVGTSFLVALRYPVLTPYVQLLPVLMMVFGLLMVSTVPLPKPRPGRNLLGKIWFVGNVVAVYFCTFLRLAPEYLLTVAVGYFLVGTIRALIAGVKAPPLPRPQPEGAAE
jgi:CDP-diacylglycerol--serine O-phosphatidyltransferase